MWLHRGNLDYWYLYVPPWHLLSYDAHPCEVETMTRTMTTRWMMKERRRRLARGLPKAALGAATISHAQLLDGVWSGGIHMGRDRGIAFDDTTTTASIASTTNTTSMANVIAILFRSLLASITWSCICCYSFPVHCAGCFGGHYDRR